MTDLELATHAALEAGKLIRPNFGTDAVVDEAAHHDIKLALDKESQDLITAILLGERPGDALYGEEGIAGNQASDRQWIVDPIDGTVNYFYGIPHFCVSIALRVAGEIVVGVIHDPMVGETWTVEHGAPPRSTANPSSQQARRPGGIDPFRRLRQGRRRASDRLRPLSAGLAARPQNADDGLRRARHGLRRLRPPRCLYRVAHLALGHRRRPAAGRSRRRQCGAHRRHGNADAWSIVATNGRIPIEEIL